MDGQGETKADTRTTLLPMEDLGQERSHQLLHWHAAGHGAWHSLSTEAQHVLLYSALRNATAQKML